MIMIFLPESIDLYAMYRLFYQKIISLNINSNNNNKAQAFSVKCFVREIRYMLFFILNKW